MSAMASEITRVTIVYSAAVQVQNKEKFRVTGLCAGKSPVTGEFPVQRIGNAENVSI